MTDEHPLLTAERLALIAIGGFAGSNLRYFVGLFLPGLQGTLLVNVAGSFLLGFILYEALHTELLARTTRVVVGTGFISSFTTYSTFMVESVGAGGWLLVANVFATYGFGFAGVLLGRHFVTVLDGGTT
jgi:CrcB protein